MTYEYKHMPFVNLLTVNIDQLDGWEMLGGEGR